MAKKIEIKKTITTDANVSIRKVTYDVYVKGEYNVTFEDINDALDYKEEMEVKEDINELKLEVKSNFFKLHKANEITKDLAEYMVNKVEIMEEMELESWLKDTNEILKRRNK